MRFPRHWIGSPTATAAWCALLGTALGFAPEALPKSLRGGVCDLLQPGLQGVRDVRLSWSNWQAARATEQERLRTAELEALRRRLADAEGQSRRLIAQLAQLQEAVAVGNAAPLQTSPGAPRLFVPAVVDAAVLGEGLAEDWRSGRILDRGWSHGVRESSLVLASRKPLLDVGQREQLAPEDTVFTGRIVLGKVSDVGRWTSAFVPITDADYRARAQLVHEGARGPAWGAQGLLRGDGRGCRLEGVPAEEVVRIGDWVYTADRDGALSEPLLFGRVTEATVEADEREWKVVVAPAPAPSRLTSVQILRAALNPARLVAH